MVEIVFKRTGYYRKLILMNRVKEIVCKIISSGYERYCSYKKLVWYNIGWYRKNVIIRRYRWNAVTIFNWIRKLIISKLFESSIKHLMHLHAFIHFKYSQQQVLIRFWPLFTSKLLDSPAKHSIPIYHALIGNKIFVNISYIENNFYFVI